jgi:CRP-like cAMP-binding protein
LFLDVVGFVAPVLTDHPLEDSGVAGCASCTVRAMPADRKLSLLSQVQMFSALNKRELGLISKAADVVRIPEGTEIMTEGTVGHEFYMVLEGEAIVRRGGRKVATLGPGRYFGELALLAKAPRSATVVAGTPLEALVIGQREFLAVLDEVPAVAHKLLVSMATRLREADTKALSH